jgi:NAD(P)-dependent dehydrogenase (short-subunit alcohol dehydrogenase family)
MEIKDKVVIVTGGANGIGKALCEKFAKEGARAIVVSDIDKAGIDKVVAAFPTNVKGLGVVANVGKEDHVKNLVDETISAFGHIDLFCSNAGILMLGGEEVATEDWQKTWDINVMSNVFASRYALPHMLKRGEGYFFNTASAAGLLNQAGAAPYAVSKHAVVAYAEWLSLTYGNEGIKVSILCPQAVNTDMISEGTGSAGLDGVEEPEDLAQCVVDTIAVEKFLCLPHPLVEKYIQHKTNDYDRWLSNMRKIKEKYH